MRFYKMADNIIDSLMVDMKGIIMEYGIPPQNLRILLEGTFEFDDKNF